MPDIIVLNGSDREQVEQFIEEQKNQLINEKGSRTSIITDGSPEVYVIRPFGRVPPRGTNPDGSPRPGRAVVGVWKLVEDPPQSDRWKLEPVLYPDQTQKTLTLNNIDPDWLEYDFYDISRDAYGQWIITCCT